MGIGTSIADSLIDRRDCIWIKRNYNAELNQYNKDGRNKHVRKCLSASNKQQIDEFFGKYYGKKIPYDLHEVYTSFSGKFHADYFPEFLYYPLVYHFNNDNDYIEVMSDKNFLPVLAKACNVDTPKTVIHSSQHVLFDGLMNEINLKQAVRIISLNERDMIIKPSIESSQGTGVSFIDRRKDIKKILDKYGTDFVVQEVVNSHKSISNLHPESLNTLRVVTYRLGGKIYHLKNNVLRMGVGSNRIDNASAGGILIGVKPDGTLQKSAMNLYCKEKNIFEHPNTSIKFENYQIAGYDKVLECAVQMHKCVPKIGFIDWDFSINEYGHPLLIEANVREGGGMRMSQWVNGEPAFGENTSRILSWLREVENISRSERISQNICL